MASPGEGRLRVESFGIEKFGENVFPVRRHTYATRRRKMPRFSTDSADGLGGVGRPGGYTQIQVLIPPRSQSSPWLGPRRAVWRRW